ncbi:syntaxin-32-like [Chenopodium quinoa]|uniref:syntaxin-32-like n=1 Tax=Chenopodium quinoa TaxID=63459 RepID=UPI000B7843F6|nr:syntaxin-32-like [Chenopodium quinoa]
MHWEINNLRKLAVRESQPLLQQQNQQQQQMVPLQETCMQSRAESLQNVDSTIHELNNIFTPLATMVLQQGHITISESTTIFRLRKFQKWFRE